MFKLKNTPWSLCLLLALSFTLALSSCSSDDTDDEPEDFCPDKEFLSQNAKGTFMSDAFSVVEGTAKESSFEPGQFQFSLYGTTVPGDACDGFNFDKPDSTIIFTLPIVVGLYELGANQNVSFNHAVPNETNVVVALCGAIEITAVTATSVTGKIDAFGDDDNILNGNFTAVVCQ